MIPVDSDLTVNKYLSKDSSKVLNSRRRIENRTPGEVPWKTEHRILQRALVSEILYRKKSIEQSRDSDKVRRKSFYNHDEASSCELSNVEFEDYLEDYINIPDNMYFQDSLYTSAIASSSSSRYLTISNSSSSSTTRFIIHKSNKSKSRLSVKRKYRQISHSKMVVQYKKISSLYFGDDIEYIDHGYRCCQCDAELRVPWFCPSCMIPEKKYQLKDRIPSLFKMSDGRSIASIFQDKPRIPWNGETNKNTKTSPQTCPWDDGVKLNRWIDLNIVSNTITLTSHDYSIQVLENDLNDWYF